MFQRNLLFVCHLFLPFLVYPQALRHPVAGQYTGLVALSRHQADVFSRMQQQAALADARYPEAGVFGEQRYQLRELGMYAAAAAIPSSRGNFGMLLRYAGFSSYYETQFGLAYARQLGENVLLGMQVNHHSYLAAFTGRAGTFNMELGALIRAGHFLSLGIHVYNPVGGYFSKTGERLVPLVTLGLGYDASEAVFIGAELKKEMRGQLQLFFATQYRFQSRFFIRAGINTAAGEGVAGAGIAWGRKRLDITGSYHPQLGWTPGLFLLFCFNQAASAERP